MKTKFQLLLTLAYSKNACYNKRFSCIDFREKDAKFKHILSKKKEKKSTPHKQIIHIPSKYIKNTEQDFFLQNYVFH